MNEFQGVSAAAITPRGPDGDIDRGAMLDLIEHLCRGGVRAIVLFGAAGEYPAFAAEERSRALYLAVKRSRAPILVGVGSSSFDTSVSLARDAYDADAAGVLVPPPFFFRYGQEEIREFYLQFAAEAGKGATIFLCNEPETGNCIEAGTAAELLETGLFAGIADGSPAPSLFAGLRERLAFVLLRDADETVVCELRAGAGVISRAACAVPELAAALDGSVCAGRRDSEPLDACLQEFAAWAARFPQPVIAKAATALRGIKTGPLAVPLSGRQQRELEEFREWFRAWLPGVRRLCGRG